MSHGMKKSLIASVIRREDKLFIQVGSSRHNNPCGIYKLGLIGSQTLIVNLKA